jgi:hypothetical protein
MRDLVVREGLEAMARDAAKLFRELIRAGEEIPYEVREPGDGSPLCRYEPLTERFVRDHAGELRELDSFGAGCAALESADVSGGYLESMGVPVPAEARARAELAGIVFLCRLWMDSTDFSLDRERLDATIGELEIGEDVDANEIEVVVPLRGLQMPTTRLELATATIVRADVVDVPSEARAGDGMGASPWEPTFLAVARVAIPDESDDEGPDPGLQATATFRRLVTTLRLFKSGGVGLGPYAWTRVGGDRWRRISTGSGKPRPGGYRLGEEELGDLVAFSRALASPSSPFGRQAAERPGLPEALGRAMARFEAGLERHLPVDALNDHLLALRFVLEGGGPADLGLSMRVAALCAEPERRAEIKGVVDRALALERELWSGEPQGDGPTPTEIASELEELARAILRDAACGHLGADLRSTADEILLADGLAVGDGAAEQRGETAEWDTAGEVVDDDEEDGGEDEELEPDEDTEFDEETDFDEDEELEEVPDSDDEEEPFGWMTPGREPEPEPEPEPTQEDRPPVKVMNSPGRIIFEADRHDEEERVLARLRKRDDEQETTALEVERIREGSPVLELIEQTRSERAARADRLSGLFPRPETVEWNVRELGYERNRVRAS